jgi:hypothetical protein
MTQTPILQTPIHPMPTKALLQAAIHETFQLQDDNGAVAEVELLSVDAGVPMDRDYVCYSAVFGLPHAVFASQGTYRVSRPNGDSWSLFMTPIVPGLAGNTRLEALFHYRPAKDG